jgi:uncharacterized protein YjbJ (UPF0337 family)
MNWIIVEGNWKQFKGSLRTCWSRLTHDQHGVIVGKRIVSAGRAQKAFGIAKNESTQQLKRFAKSSRDCGPTGLS